MLYTLLRNESIKQSLPRNFFWTTPLELRPDGQPGPLPIDGAIPSLLIELEAQIL